MLRNPGKTVTIHQLALLGRNAFTKAATPHNIISGFKVSGIWPLDREVFDSVEYMPSNVTDRPAASHKSGPSTHATTTTIPSTTEIEQSISSAQGLASTSAISIVATASTAQFDQCTSSKEGMDLSSSVALELSSTSSTSTLAEPSALSPAATQTIQYVFSTQSQTPSSCVPLSAASEIGTSTDFVISPVELRGYPKAAPRKDSTRGRKRWKTMVATLTPEMARIKEAKLVKLAKMKPSASAIKKVLFCELDSDISLCEIIEKDNEIIEDEFECDSDLLNLNVVENMNVGDYVVEFSKKSNKCYYVGQVTKPRDEDDDMEIYFLRRKRGYFVKPAVPDLCSIHVDNMKAVLSAPTVRGTTQRTKGELIFNVNFGNIDIR